MSPLEIPGIILKFIDKAGTKECPKCGRYFDRFTLDVRDGFIFKRCPYCNRALVRYDRKKIAKQVHNQKKTTRQVSNRKKIGGQVPNRKKISGQMVRRRK